MLQNLFFTFCFCLSFHDFHISRSEINYDVSIQSIQVACHIFIDDLEAAIGQSGLHIGTAKEAANADIVIAEYLRKHFRIVAGAKILAHDYIGKEVSEDLQGIWVYIEMPYDGDVTSKLSLKNDLLIKNFDDQKNMILIKKNNKLIKQSILTSKEVEMPVHF